MARVARPLRELPAEELAALLGVLGITAEWLLACPDLPLPAVPVRSRRFDYEAGSWRA